MAARGEEGQTVIPDMRSIFTAVTIVTEVLAASQVREDLSVDSHTHWILRFAYCSRGSRSITGVRLFSHEVDESRASCAVPRPRSAASLEKGWGREKRKEIKKKHGGGRRGRRGSSI